MVTSIQKWQRIIQDPRLVQFFKNMFERLGVRIIDTGEQFTCVHMGDRIEFEPTLNDKKVDFTIEIKSYQVDRFVSETTTGMFGPCEQYRVVRAFFSPATAATLKNPVLSNAFFRGVSRIEDLTHVYLKSPAPDEPDCEDTSHTLVYVKGQWIVVPGLHGKPRRVFRLNMDDALTYHRTVFAALKANRLSQWYKFWRWYMHWRKSVSTKS